MVLTDLGTEPSVGELWSDMMKRATKLTLLALVLTTVIILVALVKEAGENPTFRASDHDSLEECLRNIPTEWLDGSIERTGAETACMHLHSGSGAALQRSGVRTEDLYHSLSVLASDSLEGRMTGTRGAAKAAAFIARAFEEYGLEPGGDDGFLQSVPMARVPMAGGRARYVLLQTHSALDTIPEERRVLDANVIGVLPGSDPELRGEAIVVAAHFDHLGVGRPDESGDSIYNGADDDASGTVAVMEIARALSSGPAPARTIVFLAATAEELGMLGTRWYLDHPTVPLESTVGMLAIEMIGRPDSLAGGRGRAWLTGYERSTMGDILEESGIPIVPDPRPEQNFFLRSDNAPFAFLGIPAHTLSSYNLHEDYHRPSDEIDKIDFEHMTEVVDAAIRAVRVLADGPRPEWHPGGRPERPTGRR